MKTSKTKILVALMAALLVVTLLLTACSSSKPADSAAVDAADDGAAAADDGQENGVYDLAYNFDNVVSLGTPDVALNPDEVYKKTHYIPEMFMAEYKLLGGDPAVEKYIQDVGFFKFNEAAYSGGGVERELTNIPYEIEGSVYLNKTAPDSTGYLYVMEARFVNAKDNAKETRKFLYTVSSAEDVHTLKLKEIKNIDLEGDHYDEIVSYEEGQLELEYQFNFRGFALTLERDGKSLTLHTGYDSEDNGPNVSLICYLTKGSPTMDHIAGFFMSRSAKSDSSSFTVTFINDKNEDEDSSYAHGQLTDSGLFTFSVPYATETKTYQYVFFMLGYNGIILTDGDTNYKYTYDEDDFKAYKLGAVLGDGSSADDISADKAKELTVAQNSILTELEEALAKKNIKASIDKATGKVSLDSNILFASDSYELSDEGKSSLDEFLDVYTSVLLSDAHKDVVKNIYVEGHTDTNGTHEYNQTLSENRAKTVSDYCISKVPELKDIITAKGYSYDDPVYNDDGTVNMEASRRVVFRFTLESK